jgi:hypothetical protein
VEVMNVSSDTAQLPTNETASICFRDAGMFRYTVRMESGKTTGEINVPGVIKVGGQGGQAVDQTTQQNRLQTTRPVSDKHSDRNGDKPSDSTSTTSTTTTTTTPLR